MNQGFSSLGNIDELRDAVASYTWRSESKLFDELKTVLNLDNPTWAKINYSATEMIERLRASRKQPLIDQFLTEYGLATEEGVQLMRLAEALSRTVDPVTADELISDKIMNQDWRSHTGAGKTLAMSLSGRALHVTDKWLKWANNHHDNAIGNIARAGNATLRWATRKAVKTLSSQFVFAETLDSALTRGRKASYSNYLFSFDMLGEAARTKADARKYYQAYADALDRVARNAGSNDPEKNNGISIKLSALHPRYHFSQAKTVVPEIAEMLLPLAVRARKANVQITIDAEEAERLDISMDVLETLVSMPELRGWHGLGFVAQAYQRRALPLLDWLEAMSVKLDAPLMIRLVKGAYWDSEIKLAQEMGLKSYPVYTRKEMTDLSYLACAKKLLSHPDRFTPQFATHNAHSIAAVRDLAGSERKIEFQRLFGMGQQLHDAMLKEPNVTSRIYAPVGAQKDLLSYLIRRLLENGANSSFVNKLADPAIDPSILGKDPLSLIDQHVVLENEKIPAPRQYLGEERDSAAGWDLSDPRTRARFQQDLDGAASENYSAKPVSGSTEAGSAPQNICSPTNLSEVIGTCVPGDEQAANSAMETASAAFASWSGIPVHERARILQQAALLLEQRSAKFHYLAIKEAGKTWLDAVAEVREAVDFCRYYAARAMDESFVDRQALGVVICISPWNFPLAIFLGQVTAALAAGNTVVAKPAEQTPLIAAEAVQLLHDAGVDPAALNLVPGDGAVVGEALVAHARAAGLCFTGSTATAKRIALRLAELGRSQVPLIAETGGINAMIVDSSALLEQTVDAVVSSAFQSAGQRCSALRIVCVQDDIADEFEQILRGAMDALQMGDPYKLETDIGPVIDAKARDNITAHIERLKGTVRKIGETKDSGLTEGHFVRPIAFELPAFEDLEREVFGPVLHLVRFDACDKLAMINKINQSGYGLTMGIQSRIDSIADRMSADGQVGNIYINRNQIGAVVGVQPFGGEGLSGTGPKAGGPLYLRRLSKPAADATENPRAAADAMAKNEFLNNDDEPDKLLKRAVLAHKQWEVNQDRASILTSVTAKLDPQISDMAKEEIKNASALLPGRIELPSPAGETNQYSWHGRGLIISLVKDWDVAVQTSIRALMAGNSVVHLNVSKPPAEFAGLMEEIASTTDINGLLQMGNTNPAQIFELIGSVSFDGLLVSLNDPNLDEYGIALAKRDGPILPILTPCDQIDRYVLEKTITNNIAAAGGDVSLLNSG